MDLVLLSKLLTLNIYLPIRYTCITPVDRKIVFERRKVSKSDFHLPKKFVLFPLMKAD